jgi:alpha-beta hydrolase superfamily lysophospholipase
MSWRLSSNPPINVDETPTRSAVVASFDGTPIYYDYYDAAGPDLAVIIPGFWRSRAHASMRRLAKLLRNEGMRTAVIDVRGHGDSGGKYGFNLYEHEDVAAVLRELMSQTGARRVSLVGLSLGGEIAISTMARHSFPWGGLLLISPVAQFARIIPKINLLTIHRHIAWGQAFKKPRFDWRFRRSEKLDGLRDIESIHVPVCLIHVENDWLIHHSHSVALYDRANEPKELHILDIPGNYHADRVFAVAPERVDPLVISFVKRNCGETTP